MNYSYVTAGPMQQMLPNQAWPIYQPNIETSANMQTYSMHLNSPVQYNQLQALMQIPPPMPSTMIPSPIMHAVTEQVDIQNQVFMEQSPARQTAPNKGVSKTMKTMNPAFETEMLPSPPPLDDVKAVNEFLERLINSKILDVYASDKFGSRFMQKAFPEDAALRQKLYNAFLKLDLFLKLSDDVFGNFVIQKAIEEAKDEELKWICIIISTNIVHLSLDRFACRVVQKALEHFDTGKQLALINQMLGFEKDFVTDRNGNHVIQKIMQVVPFSGYGKLLQKLVSSKVVVQQVIENKYGCRVIQCAIQKLAGEKGNVAAKLILQTLINTVTINCSHYISHQFSNYVVQSIIAIAPLEQSCEMIIQKLLNNMLSYSQEKYASHVVETAILYAPPNLLLAMMDEIFDGYEADRYGQDALDVLLFDQFGNYVVQTMLDVAIEVKQGKREGNQIWFNRLANRIIKHQLSLIKYSSGKRIIEKLSEAILSNKNALIDENLDPEFKELVVPEKFS